jgi:hypothetical protein
VQTQNFSRRLYKLPLVKSADKAICSHFRGSFAVSALSATVLGFEVKRHIQKTVFIGEIEISQFQSLSAGSDDLHYLQGAVSLLQEEVLSP